jgi:hypothetical protein
MVAPVDRSQFLQSGPVRDLQSGEKNSEAPFIGQHVKPA